MSSKGFLEGIQLKIPLPVIANFTISASLYRTEVKNAFAMKYPQLKKNPRVTTAWIRVVNP